MLDIQDVSRSEIHEFYQLFEYLCVLGPIGNASADYLEIVDCKQQIPDDRQDLDRFCIGIHSNRKNHR